MLVAKQGKCDCGQSRRSTGGIPSDRTLIDLEKNKKKKRKITISRLLPHKPRDLGISVPAHNLEPSRKPTHHRTTRTFFHHLLLTPAASPRVLYISHGLRAVDYDRWTLTHRFPCVCALGDTCRESGYYSRLLDIYLRTAGRRLLPLYSVASTSSVIRDTRVVTPSTSINMPRTVIFRMTSYTPRGTRNGFGIAFGSIVVYDHHARRGCGQSRDSVLFSEI